MSLPYAPAPPVYTTVNGGPTTSETIISQSQQAYSNNSINADVINDTSSSSSSSVSSSMVIVVIILSSAIIVTASIYILLQFLSRRSRRTYATADEFVLRNNNNTSSDTNDCHVGSEDGGGLHGSLPLFKFGSVTGNLTGGDCAVCLSKFERHDKLRLLPLCCHAFHARCIDTWLSTNQTCPLCRSTVYPTDADVLNKILSVPNNTDQHRGGGAVNESTNSGSFRIEIGNISPRRGEPDAAGDGPRSYSIGSFEYIVDNGYEISVDSTHRRGASVDKEFVGVTVAEPPGESLTAEVASGRNWLKEYVDRLASFSLSSRTTSLRSSGRFFTGSGRRNDVVVPVEDLEANRIGEEISELFRWLSGV